MRVLLLGTNQESRYNSGHQLFKNEVARQTNARFYGPGHKFWDPSRAHINQILRVLEFQPDVVLTYMGKYCKWVVGLDEIKLPKAHIVVDYFPWNFKDEDSFITASKPDVVFPVVLHELRELERRHPDLRVKHLPFSVDANFFRCTGRERKYDLMAVMSAISWCYPTRGSIITEAKSLNLPGIYRASWPANRLMPDDYVKSLCNSKIVLNGVDSYRSLNWKFMEAPACGALLMTEAAEDMKALRFVDGENCVVFKGIPDMVEKIRFYLKDAESRCRIAAAGMDLINRFHTTEIRVREMLARFTTIFGVV
jgi:spore maturation protein CgeB